jgi:hypothetical protein
MKALLRRVIVAIVALLLLFEEWGWEPLAAAVARLARLPFFSWLEERVRELPPYAALVTFAAPALMLLPVKLLAVFLIARGHGLLGVIVLLAAKIAGTAVLARLFELTQPTLMQLPWFARHYPRWKAWKDRITREVLDSPAWRAGRRARASAAARWEHFRRGAG